MHNLGLNFDGVHYFYNNYDFEPNHAFLPLYVNFVQVFRKVMGDSLAIFFLMFVNKMAFLVAASDLNKILENLSQGEYQMVSQKEN